MLNKKLTLIHLFFLLLIIVVLSNCLKEKTPEPAGGGGGGGSITPASFTPQLGYIRTNISNLTLNKGSIKSISAYLFNGSDSLALTQPAFTWQSSNNAIATVSNGQVYATDTGSVLISITDGTHGTLGVNVRVVGTTTVISSNPSSIVFNSTAGVMGGSAIALLPNTSRNFNYTLYDAQGNTVTGSPIFYFTAASAPLTISGNTITSTSTLGLWDIKAKIGSNTLSGTLRVCVFQSDTTTFIEAIHETFPSHFYKENLTATKPLLIKLNKVWLSLIDGLHWTVKTISPAFIKSTYPSVIDLNSSGYLTSYTAGRTRITVGYKEDTLSYYATVAPLLAGNWTGTIPQYELNFCFPELMHDVYYGPGSPTGYASINFGTQLIKRNGSVVTNPGQGGNICYFYGNIDWNFEGKMTTSGVGWFRCFLLPSHIGGDDFFVNWNGTSLYYPDGSNSYPLSKSTGNCTFSSGGGSSPDPLDNYLKGSGTTNWKANNCWNWSYDNFIFKNDYTGSCYDKWDKLTKTFTWSTRNLTSSGTGKDSRLNLYFNGGGGIDWRFNGYSSSVLYDYITWSLDTACRYKGQLMKQ